MTALLTGGPPAEIPTGGGAAPPSEGPTEVAVAAPPEAAGRGRWGSFLGTGLRVAGGVVAVLLAGTTAIVEIFYTPLRVGGVLIGVSALAAVLVNYWLLRYTVAATGTRKAALLPPLVWFALILLASAETNEGDLLLTTNNWVAMLTIFGGSLSFAVSGYRLLLPPLPPPAQRPTGG